MVYLNITNSPGIFEPNTAQNPDNGFPQMDNMWTKPDRNAWTFTGNVMNKVLNNRETFATAIGRASNTFDHTTDTIVSTANNLINGMQVKLNTVGTLPPELTDGGTYYIINQATDSFQISTSSGGSAVTFSTNGTGTHYYSIVGKGRGILQYFPTVGDPTGSYLIIFMEVIPGSQGKFYTYDINNSVWAELLFTLETVYPYHAQMKQYGDHVYIATPNHLYKWHPSFGNVLGSVSDKSVVSNIDTAILTWNMTDLVTSNTVLSPALFPGQFIRRSSSSVYWDEVASVTNSGLNINLVKDSLDTGSSGVGTAQANIFTTNYNCTCLEFWKDKMWIACNYDGNNFSALYWFVSFDPDNGDTTLGAGNLLIDNKYGERITGVVGIDDSIFIFKDHTYLVYRWSGDIDEPIQQVAKFNYGCVSNRTIINIPGYLIYYSGSDIRITDGSTDQSLLDGKLDKTFQYNNTLGYASLASTYYSGNLPQDNSYPWAVYDEVLGVYRLYYGLNNVNCLVLDVKSFLWIGKEVSGSTPGSAVTQGVGTKVYLSTTPGPTIVQTPNTPSSNFLTKYNSITMKYDTNDGAIIRSKIYDFGLPGKKKKIDWVEFVFHAAVGCKTQLAFGFWDNSEEYVAAEIGGKKVFDDSYPPNLQTFELDYASGTDYGDYTTRRFRQRFTVDKELYEFAWYLTEAVDITATNGWGIDSITISYDLVDTP